jgi:hypothetical protein
MMSYFLSLPRASWKARVVAAIVIVWLVADLVHQWQHRHDDLAVARWISWGSLIGDTWLLWLAFTVCILGRMPKVLRRLPGGLNRTLPQIHAEIAKEIQEKRDRSRWL